jgi:hypothetical protein
MSVFPKSCLFNTNGRNPPICPDASGLGLHSFRPSSSTSRAAHRSLAGLGIGADLILFHPYDRWGFSAMPATADDRYVSTSSGAERAPLRVVGDGQ